MISVSGHDRVGHGFHRVPVGLHDQRSIGGSVGQLACGHFIRHDLMDGFLVELSKFLEGSPGKLDEEIGSVVGQSTCRRARGNAVFRLEGLGLPFFLDTRIESARIVDADKGKPPVRRGVRATTGSEGPRQNEKQILHD